MFRVYYEKLLTQTFDSNKHEQAKPVWKWILEKELTACPCFVGNQYSSSNLKLMIVGRAVNGWDIDTDSCTSLEDTLDVIMNQESRFEDVANEAGVSYFDSKTQSKKVYHYSRSRFWKLIQYILEESGEGQNFHQKIVWSNLYKIAPYNTGNPAWRLIRPNMQTYIDCLIEEIRFHKPSHIVFITGMDYLNPWLREPQFGTALGIGRKNQTSFNNRNYESGIFEGSKIVVCGRPENKSLENIRMMAKEIIAEFNNL